MPKKKSKKANADVDPKGPFHQGQSVIPTAAELKAQNSAYKKPSEYTEEEKQLAEKGRAMGRRLAEHTRRQLAKGQPPEDSSSESDSADDDRTESVNPGASDGGTRRDDKVETTTVVQVEVPVEANQVEKLQPAEATEAKEVEVSEVQSTDKPKQSRTVIRQPKFEVVVVGVMRYMPISEIKDEAGAVEARRIMRRIEGKLEPTTAIVLTYDKQPPVLVNIHYESFRTRTYIHQTARCFNCQGWNHRQAGCKKPARCARCGEQHKTAQCQMKDSKNIKCANCGEGHSSAAPICRKYKEVKEAWRLVALESRSYADAIKLTSSAAVTSRSNTATWGRADVIEASNSDSMSQVPTAVRKQWAIARRPATTRSIATQTDEAPVEQSTQTKVGEQAAQATQESEDLQLEDKYIISTLVEIVGKLMEQADQYDNSKEWNNLVEKFEFVEDRMATRGFPMKLRRSSRNRGGKKKK